MPPNHDDNLCRRQCCLNGQDICLGCGRSLDEILAWHAVNHYQRKAIAAQAKQRLKDLEKSRG